MDRLSTAIPRIQRIPSPFESRASLLMATAFYIGVLQFVFQVLVEPTFPFAGVRYEERSVIGYAIGIACTMTVALLMPRSIRKPSDFILWIVFAIAGAPSILISQYAVVLRPEMAVRVALAVAASLAFARGITSLSVRSIMPQIVLDRKTLLTLGIGFSVLIYSYMIYRFGISLKYVSLSNVYDVRAAYIEGSTGDRVIGYLVPVQYQVLNPLMMILGLSSKRLSLWSAGALGQAYIYIAAGYKAVLFSIFAVIAIHFLFRRAWVSAVRLLVGIICGAAFSALSEIVVGVRILSDLYLRRLLVVPGILTASYVTVFEHRTRGNFAEILPFADVPFEVLTATNIVGAEIIGNAATSANVNLWGHGYLQMGFIGMFVECAFFGFVLLVADDAARHVNLSIICSIFLMPALAIAQSSVFTVMTTHGFLAAVLVSAALPRSATAKAVVDPTRRVRVRGGTWAAVKPPRRHTHARHRTPRTQVETS